MKVAHVTPTFPPYWAGTGNVAYHHARVLHSRGYDVTVFTGQLQGGETLKVPFRVCRLPEAFKIGNAPLTPQLVKRLKGFDVIHLHYPFIFGAELSLMASVRYGIPMVVSYHNQLNESIIWKKGLFSAYNHIVEPRVLRHAAKIAAVSRGHFMSVHPGLNSNPKVVVIPNGVDTSQFVPSNTSVSGVSCDPPVILFVGALDQAHRFKNVEGLLGGGDRRQGIQEYARSIGLLPSTVSFLGEKSPQDLVPLYNAASITVLPSTTTESFGLVLIESMACGTPVVASDLPGIREVVDHGRDGFLVPVGDEVMWVKAIERALERDTKKVLGPRARQKVVSRFSWESVVDKLEVLYSQVVGK
ncbi:MAG: glycosyltransferase family 4 protein [Acidithiobacillus sp.]|nr:glycosyltransferase family 4 protein [Acidithiobacillus sp.]